MPTQRPLTLSKVEAKETYQGTFLSNPMNMDLIMDHALPLE